MSSSEDSHGDNTGAAGGIGVADFAATVVVVLLLVVGRVTSRMNTSASTVSGPSQSGGYRWQLELLSRVPSLGNRTDRQMHNNVRAVEIIPSTVEANTVSVTDFERPRILSTPTYNRYREDCKHPV